jgi:hypothetical protein
MAKLPNGDRASVDIRKLTDYVLDPTHRLGRHKARVFATVFDLTVEDAGELQSALLRAASVEDAETTRQDAYGVHYVIEFTLEFRGRRGRVRALWTIRTGEDSPRFVTAFVAKKDE